MQLNQVCWAAILRPCRYAPPFRSLLGQREITMLQASLTASSQRTHGELKPLLLRLGESIAA